MNHPVGYKSCIHVEQSSDPQVHARSVLERAHDVRILFQGRFMLACHWQHIDNTGRPLPMNMYLVSSSGASLRSHELRQPVHGVTTFCL